ncbi:hypothetical protein ASG29_13275 [Sphingomonas sp. Leaf412]|uniref:hypothetical protein n=1 Tax=Sphingomonas sp. Leaf412 TaxID=1736370 RepID=UPI0006F33B05|nr:hypothetical protein [Sphingomonas sp. Leaf412]KQT32697.1 hypothetical protein ASG29_13275 [Sphingomonas sp. Leaf412]
MKRISNAILAAALTAGVAPLALMPAAAAAQKKEKEQKAPTFKLSKDFRELATKAQAAVTAKDVATAEPLVAQMEASAATDDEKYIAASTRLNVEVTKSQASNNTAGLKGPLVALMALQRTPQEDKAKYAYQLGIMANNAKDFAGATTYFQQAQQLGYNDPNLPLQLVKLKLASGDTAGGTADLAKLMDAQVAAGQKPDEQLYRYAISSTNQKKMGAETLSWIRRYLTAYPTAKNWRDMVVFYGIQPQAVVKLDKQQAVDLYRLLRTGKALADQYDYELYAQYTLDQGIPWEAKAVLTEGKAAGKVPAGSANATGLLSAANTSIGNEGSLASLETRAKASANGKLANGTGDAYLGSGNWAKAVELYRVALAKGGVDADAMNTRIGIALANSGDKAGAKAAFETVKTPPRDGVAALWLTFLDAPPVG